MQNKSKPRFAAMPAVVIDTTNKATIRASMADLANRAMTKRLQTHGPLSADRPQQSERQAK